MEKILFQKLLPCFVGTLHLFYIKLHRLSSPSSSKLSSSSCKSPIDMFCWLISAEVVDLPLSLSCWLLLRLPLLLFVTDRFSSILIFRSSDVLTLDAELPLLFSLLSLGFWVASGSVVCELERIFERF